MYLSKNLHHTFQQRNISKNVIFQHSDLKVDKSDQIENEYKVTTG